MNPTPCDKFISNWRRVAPALLALLVAGCTVPGAMQSSFNDYSAVYADTQNRQMLLNLARLHEGFPTYFFQLGQINANYTYTETAGLAGSRTTTQTGAAPSVNGLTSSFSVGGTVTHSPSFVLVPLAGDKFATQLLTPIKPLIFEQYFDQGWPADQLMRLLVERIELDIPDKTDPTKVITTEVLENNPWADETIGYDRFLRACGLARECQRKGLLHLVRTDDFMPLAEGASQTAQPTPELLANADKAGEAWMKVGADWQLGKVVQHDTFVLDKGDATEKFIAGLREKAPYVNNLSSINNYEQALRAGGFNLSDKTTSSNGEVHVRFVLRSLMGVITALATEQQAFEGRKGDQTYFANIPGEEYRPLLQVIWPDAGTPAEAVTAVDFQGKHYVIADPAQATGRADTWNRDVFRLMIQLSFQVTTDAANLPASPVVSIKGG